MKRLLALTLACAALVLGACTSSSPKPTPSTTLAPAPGSSAGADGGTVNWQSCNEIGSQLLGHPVTGYRLDCGSISVPQDWHHAGNGKRFTIALIRLRSTTQANRIGSLLINPGGPGASGVEEAVGLSQELPKAVGERFDVIGFDPRGVGRSSPVECINPKQEDASYGAEPDPVSHAAFNDAVALAKRMEAACGKKYGAKLPLFSTEQAARDMGAIGTALGESKLNYLGYSYGTLLGAVYAQLYPKNFRAMVLDGAIDPLQDVVARSESQAAGFERAFGDFVSWCHANALQCPISRDPRGAVVGAIAASRAAPLPYKDGRKVTSGWVYYGVIQAMYLKSLWPILGQAIAMLNKHDPSLIMQLADAYTERQPGGQYPNLLDANLAVNCADFGTEPTVAQVRKLQAQWRAKYPLFGAPTAIGLLGCAVGEWPGKYDPYPTGPAKGAPPILVVGTRNDPATPYAGTAKLANMLGVGEVLTWDGDGHTAYPLTPCITNAVNNYLINLKLPPKNTVCPAS